MSDGGTGVDDRSSGYACDDGLGTGVMAAYLACSQ